MATMFACDPYSARALNLGPQNGSKSMNTMEIGFSLDEPAESLASPHRFLAREAQEFTLPQSHGGGTIKGHLASDPEHASYPSSHYEIRTYMPVDGGQVAAVDFRELLDKVRIPSTPSQRYVVSGEQIDAIVEKSDAERTARLSNPTASINATRVVPKDGSLNPTDIDIYVRNSTDVSAKFVTELGSIGEIEGFHMVAGVPSHGGDELARNLDRAGAKNVSIVEHPNGEAWVEDYGEPVLGGGRLTPAIFDDKNGAWSREAIREGRAERYKKAGPGGKDIVDNNSYHGAVNYGKFQRAHLAEGIAEGQTDLRQAVSYIEGGNTMTGSLPNGEGYALVGADSFHVTKRLVEKQTGKTFSDDDVRKIIAADFGIKAENVHSIEQPGTFHIDMRLTPIGPGEILLNDSVAAAKQQATWRTEDLENQAVANGWSASKLADAKKKLKTQTDAIMEQAQYMKVLEDLTARDLQAVGFKVDRLGGAFVDPNRPIQDNTNYFNARHGTNESGERFTVMMGGTPREEAYVATHLFNDFHAPISHLHFLDPAQTRRTLDLQGGLKCRTKPEGNLVNGELLTHPERRELVSA